MVMEKEDYEEEEEMMIMIMMMMITIARKYECILVIEFGWLDSKRERGYIEGV